MKPRFILGLLALSPPVLLTAQSGQPAGPPPPPPNSVAPPGPPDMMGADASNGNASAASVALRSAEQLDQLLGPIALYPDALIALILPASTASSDIVLASRFLNAAADPAQIDAQPWDESVKSLSRYPEVVKWMDENLAWTQQLGEAFTVQPAEVMNSVQRLRQAARAAGTLVDTPQQQVVAQNEVISIVPAEPDVIYVPRYDPEVVYINRGIGVGFAFLAFGPAYRVGPWLDYECDWRGRRVWVDYRIRSGRDHYDWRRPPSFPSGPRFSNDLNRRPWTPSPNRGRPNFADAPRPHREIVRPAPFPDAPRFPSNGFHNDGRRTPDVTASRPNFDRTSPNDHSRASGRGRPEQARPSNERPDNAAVANRRSPAAGSPAVGTSPSPTTPFAANPAQVAGVGAAATPAVTPPNAGRGTGGRRDRGDVGAAPAQGDASKPTTPSVTPPSGAAPQVGVRSPGWRRDNTSAGGPRTPEQNENRAVNPGSTNSSRAQYRAGSLERPRVAPAPGIPAERAASVSSGRYSGRNPQPNFAPPAANPAPSISASPPAVTTPATPSSDGATATGGFGGRGNDGGGGHGMGGRHR